MSVVQEIVLVKSIVQHGTKFYLALFSPKTISRFVAKFYQTYLVTDVIPFADNNNSVVHFLIYSHNYTREELNTV